MESQASSPMKPWQTLRAGARIVMGRLVNWIPETFWLRLLQLRWQGYSAHKSPVALRALLSEAQELAKYIDQEAIRYDQGLHVKHRLTRYHDFFIHRIHPGERVLDVGCGNGAVAYDVADKVAAWVVGIDLDPANIALARERFAHPRVEYLQGDARLCLPPEAFDVVILSNILEHLPERPEFLKKLITVTKSKRLLIRVPLFEREWEVPLRQELGLEWRSDTTHETEYTLESFASEIGNANLLITHEEVRGGEIWAEVRAE